MAFDLAGINLARAAYQAALKSTAGSDPQAAAQALAGSGSSESSFADVLSSAVKNAVGTLRSGEAQATQGATGQGDIVQVVNSVTAAELTLETVVAIRDKVIAAYQDIMRMPI